MNRIRTYKSKDYNWIFDTKTGEFIRFGETIKDDPQRAPEPEILDIEISTICHQACSFCYKSNTAVGKNMTLAEFREIFAKFNLDFLTQIAFGIGSIDSCPEMLNILKYTRAHGVVPNITISGFRMRDTDYTNLAATCGAVSVSCYDNDVCFNAVQRLNMAGLKQANIHKLFSNETFDECIELIDLVKSDERLANLNAVVFLSLKMVGNRNTYTPVTDKEKYLKFITKLIDSGIRYGFDSCGCNNFSTTIKENYPEYYEKVKGMLEPCESSLFSYYINVDRVAFPCSFAEGTLPGIDLKTVDKFSDIWDSTTTEEFRTMLLNNDRSCPMYNLEVV